jgi:ABC-type branched-subunit amino acid transport system ATPase component
VIIKELKYHIGILDNEVQLIEEHFESYPIENNPYYRKFRICLPDFVIKLRLDLTNYPLLPSLSEKNQMILEKYVETYREKIIELLREKFRGELRQKIEKTRIIKDNLSFNLEVVKTWDSKEPPHMYELINSLFCIEEGSQHLVINDLMLTEDLSNITFNIHRGQSIGIFYEKAEDLIIKYSILKFFEIIAGIRSEFSGDIKIFGKYLQLTPIDELKKNIIASHRLDTKIQNMKIKKAIRQNIKITPKWKIRKRVIGSRAESSGRLDSLDRIVTISPKYKRKKHFINDALEVTGLLNRKKEKISNLSIIECLLFSISKALLKSPKVIMLSVPPGELNRLQGENFNRFMNNVKKKFHVALIIHGWKNVISNCDKILTIRGKKIELGKLDDFLSKVPHSKDIITIELNNPDSNALLKMFEIKNALFLTERRNEKYKIFTTRGDPNHLIQQLLELIGPYIYSFKKSKATFGEYLEYLELTQ